MFRSTIRRLARLVLFPAAPTTLALTAGFSFGSGALVAQEQEVDWEVEGELGASVFFGNTSQTTFNTILSTSRADSVYEFSNQARFSYGEAEDDSGDAFVVKRSWDVEAGFDWHPFARISPFAFGQATSSFERRIDFRYNVGGGGKVLLIRSETSRLDVSGAILAEQTFARETPGVATEQDESVLARMSIRFRGRRELDEGRVILSTENFYRPIIGEYGDYVLESRNSISYAFSEIISLKLSFLDTYDNRAEERGADSNNDGQILFSVLSTF